MYIVYIFIVIWHRVSLTVYHHGWIANKLELIVIMFNFSVLQLLAVNETILHGIGQFKIISKNLVRVETLTLIIYNMIYILIDALYRIETNGLYE